MRLCSLIALTIICLLTGTATAQTRRAAAADDARQRAVAAFEEGQAAQERGDHLSAVRAYTTAIAADATLFQVYYQRAVAYASLNRGGEAEADFRKVIELNPDFARAHRGLGQLLLDAGKTEEAKRELARALELEPRLAGVRLYYASALLKTGENAQAAETLQIAIVQGEADASTHALLGVALERVNKREEAFASYSRALELEGSNAVAREGRGRLFERRGEWLKAIEDYSAAYRSVPSRDLALQLAQLHARAGQGQAAIQIYRSLLREKPEDFDVRAEMIRLMTENEQGEEALKEVEKLVAAQPKNAKLLGLAGDLFFTTQPEVAASYYTRALEVNGEDNRLRVQLGAALVRGLKAEAALPVLAEAIRREPNSHAAHANLATALFKLNQYPQAAREFLWVIQSRPEIAASYYFLAICFDKLGDCQQATRAYQEFVKRADPAANKSDVEDANLRLGLLAKLAKEGKCKTVMKGKSQ